MLSATTLSSLSDAATYCRETANLIIETLSRMPPELRPEQRAAYAWHLWVAAQCDAALAYGTVEAVAEARAAVEQTIPGRCVGCDGYLLPERLTSDGACPHCGGVVVPPLAVGSE
jgi:hypothetical protein